MISTDVTLRSTRAASRWALLALVAALAACGGRGKLSLAPLPPERARTELTAARLETARAPDAEKARLRLGAALYHTGDNEAAREALEPILDAPGGIGAQASLYHAAASERLEDWSSARRGYARYLASARDAVAERRLRQVIVREAEDAVQQAIARERTLDPASFPERSITVTPLLVAGADSTLAPLGYGLADLLATDLARSSRVELVERVHLDALIRELELGASGRVDSATAPRVGRLLSARKVVGGTLTLLPRDWIRIDARISDVATAEITATPAAASALDAIFEAQKQLAFRIFVALGITLTPAERAAIEQRPTRNLGALLAYSRGVRDEAHGHYREAASEYARAAALDPRFDLARHRFQAAASISGAAAAPRTATGTGVLDRINPSPASHLTNERARQNELNAMLETSEAALLVIPIVLIPLP